MSSNIPQIQDQNLQANKKFDPHILSDDETKKLPDTEKKELMLMPGDAGNVWESAITKEGTHIGWNVSIPMIEKIAPVFYSMLTAIEPTIKSHIVFGQFRFDLKHKYNKCFRAIYNNSGQYSSKPKTFSGPSFISNVFFGSPDEVNDFLAMEENKSKWKSFGDWKIDADRHITIGLYK